MKEWTKPEEIFIPREMLEKCLSEKYKNIEIERKKPEYDKKIQIKDPSFQLIEDINNFVHMEKPSFATRQLEDPSPVQKRHGDFVDAMLYGIYDKRFL